jgi:hypothetical protein
MKHAVPDRLLRSGTVWSGVWPAAFAFHVEVCISFHCGLQPAMPGSAAKWIDPTWRASVRFSLLSARSPPPPPIHTHTHTHTHTPQEISNITKRLTLSCLQMFGSRCILRCDTWKSHLCFSLKVTYWHCTWMWVACLCVRDSVLTIGCGRVLGSMPVKIISRTVTSSEMPASEQVNQVATLSS